MKSNLSTKEKVVLEELSQIELLVIQGKLADAKQLVSAQQKNSQGLSQLTRANLDYYRALILLSLIHI